MAQQFVDISNYHRIKDVFKLPKFDANLTGQFVENTIMYAISHNLKIDFYYEDDNIYGVSGVLKGYRSVSPVALGTHVTTGNMVFRAYVLEGVSKSKRIPKWRLFRIDRIKSIRLYYVRQRARFDKLYRLNDKHIGGLIQQAEP